MNSIYKGYKMLEFYQTILGVDVWCELDTKSGKTIFSFFYNGKPYEYPTIFDTTRSIQGLINLTKINSRQKS